jgi:hypothetical protein
LAAWKAAKDVVAKPPPSAFCRRWMARAWSWETRDSLTPISAPICFIVTSRK